MILILVACVLNPIIVDCILNSMVVTQANLVIGASGWKKTESRLDRLQVHWKGYLPRYQRDLVVTYPRDVVSRGDRTMLDELVEPEAATDVH